MPRKKVVTNGPPKLNKSGEIDRRTKAGRLAPGGRDNPAGDTTLGTSPGNLRNQGYATGGPERARGIGNAAYSNSGRANTDPGAGTNPSDPGRNESEPRPGPTARATGFIRDKLRDRTNISDDGTGTGVPNYNPEPETVNLGGPSASVNPDGKTAAGVKGAMTPGGAERLVVSSFGLVANIRRRPHWAIKNPATEVRPWAADLAEVINSIPIPWVQAAGTLGAGIAVMFGIGSLVIPRAMTDAELNAFLAQYPPEVRGAVLADMAKGQAVPQPGPYPFDSKSARAETKQPKQPDPEPEPKHSGGAAPTSPGVVDGLINDGFAA